MPAKAPSLRTRLHELPWKIVAKIVSRPFVVDKLIKYATKRPYSHIGDANGDVYMYRFWLFNPYHSCDLNRFEQLLWKSKLFRKYMPSFRLHHIMQEDVDPHPHDHPWNARTIILRNFYLEERLIEDGDMSRYDMEYRRAGDTAPIRFNQFHRIDMVPEGGVWTLFITFKYMGTWGFLVDGKKIDYRKYLYGWEEIQYPTQDNACVSANSQA